MMLRKSSLLVAILATIAATVFTTSSGAATAAVAGGAAASQTTAAASSSAVIVRHQSADRGGKQATHILKKSTFLCDSWTHICVKFNKSETVSISRAVGPGIVGAAAWAGYLCGLVGNVVIAGACTAIIAVYAYLLARSFDSAAATGRCVELHFGLNVTNPIGAFWWKTEGC